LGAALFALLAILLWVAIFLGQLELTMALPPMLWHAHEVLFGFAIAVIVGFLLTAVKAWTGLTTPRGAFLGALAWSWSLLPLACCCRSLCPSGCRSAGDRRRGLVAGLRLAPPDPTERQGRLTPAPLSSAHPPASFIRFRTCLTMNTTTASNARSRRFTQKKTC